MATNNSRTLVRSTKRSYNENRFAERENIVRGLPTPDCTSDQYQLMDVANLIFSRLLSSRTRTVQSRPLGLAGLKTLVPGSPKIFVKDSKLF
jgi:hypothetical protein